jgi:type IV pilus assembly protein PilN
MIKINLLPYREIIRRENIITHGFIAGATLFLIIIIIISVDYVMRSKIGDVKKEIARVEREIASNKVTIDEINKLKEEKEIYRKQFQIIENLKKGKEGPVRILDELASRIPKKMWLISLKQSGNNLELEGVAVENKLISKLMVALEESPYFQKVDLIASEMKLQSAGRKTKVKLNRFTLTCLITSFSQG